MKLNSWLHSLRGIHRRTRTNGLPVVVEHMEERTLLSVAALFVGGELFVSSDGGDSITVQQNVSGRVEILANGLILGTAPNVATSAVTSIVIKGGDDANDINLNNVTNTTYPSVTSIQIDAGNGDDVILGSPFYGDSILSGDGDDSIDGQAGSDTLNGGDGDDTIRGRDGNDNLIGEDGTDSITGDDGNDTISGGDHGDTITGDAGDDSIDSGMSNDTVSGGDGNDAINGMDGADSLTGDAGNDSLLGGAGDDIVSGNDGDDIILGQAGLDTLNGDLGNDNINGGDGNDSLSGNLGNDTLNGAGGNDLLRGNEGDDLLQGGAGNDTLAGFLGNDKLLGQAGNDLLNGGADIVFQTQADGSVLTVVTPGGGVDSMDGGVGDDLVDSGDAIPDPPPVTISVANTLVAEGNAGTSNLVFTLTLNTVSFLPVSVTVNTAEGFATAGTDYTAISNQVVTIAPGALTATVTVTVQTDTVNEPDETVRLILSNPVNGRLLNQEAQGTITDDDNPPIALFAIDDFGQIARVNPATAVTTIISNVPLFNTVDIEADANNNMVALDLGFFFGSIPQLVTINGPTGQVLSTVNVTGLPPGISEGDIAFDTAGNAIYAVFSGTGNPSLFRIDPTTGVATNVGAIQVGNGNLAAATDNVEFDYLAFRPAGGGQPATLFGAISGGVTGANANFNDALFSINTATAVATRVGALGPNLGAFEGGMTWDSTGNRLLLADGNAARLASVDPVTGAATNIGQDFDLFNTTGLTFARDPALPPANFQVNNVSVTETDQGTATVQFQVTRSSAVGAATVNFATVDGTATAGTDYVAQAGTLTFAAGVASQTVTVTVNGDFAFEGAETFFLQLSNPTGIIIGDGSGVATIVNNDTPPLADTLLGNTGNDTLLGSPAGDLLNGGDGVDSILGNGGDDSILGGTGPDTIDGGDGNDTINGQGGADVIQTGNGDDVVIWEGALSGNDTVRNASGADGVLASFGSVANTVTVGQTPIPLGGTFGFMQVTEGTSKITIDSSINQVTIDGGAGDDLVTIGDLDLVCRGVLTVRGGLGNDVLNATNAKTGLIRLRMEGGDGNDTLIGGQGNDTLLGEAGIDRLRGGLGNDLAIGGVSIDSINGEGGDDTLIGGDGTDTLVGDGSDTISGDEGNDSIRGDQGNDILAGNDGNDTIRGGDGNDTITGDLGNDSLLGETSSDNINGGDGNDTVDGGRNNDVLNGGAGNDKLRGDHGEDTISGGGGNDTINGGDGNDIIQGQAGADLITGADGDDTVNGGDGNDILTGGDGNDVMNGGDGNDIVLGDQGDDLINGNASTDTLAGGQGDDTIVGAVAGEINETFVLSAALLAALSAT